MGIVTVQSLPQEQWSHFVKTHPAGNIFQTPEMFQVFERVKGHRPELWAAVEGDQVLALLLPVHVTLMGGILRYLTARAVAYGSILYAPGDQGKAALRLLLQTFRQEVDGPLLFTELRNLTSMKDVQPILDEQGFLYEDHLNYLIDLDRPAEDILQSMGKRTRKNIRRGLRKGEVNITEVQNLAQVGICYDLLCETYRMAGVPLTDRSLFDAAFNVLYPKEMVRFTLAWVDQTPVATSVELLYKDQVYGWYGGVDRDYSAYMPNELLMWHILEWSAEHGYRLYDFGGAGKPDEEYGVRDFKAKFGGDLVCYGRNTCIHSPNLLRLSKVGYALYRRFL